MPRRDLADRHVHRGGDRAPDRLLGPGLDLAGPPQSLQCHRPERVQQHRLADPAQPGEHHAALRAAAGHALEHDFKLPDFPVAAGQLRWPLTGSGSVGVAHRVHVIGLYGQIYGEP